MKVSDYVVEYLMKKGVTDVFGYPGGMVTHLMESFRKYEGNITAHVTYHEQAAAFAACGYAQASGKPGVAYATSGPGATNLITGICNAYFDSIPTVFITGQVNTFEARGNLGVRQRGFQETDIVSMVKSVTKYAAYVDSAKNIRFYLENAFEQALSGRMGPVLLDIPMDVFRSEIVVDDLNSIASVTAEVKSIDNTSALVIVEEALKTANRPCIILGNGVKISQNQENARMLVKRLGIPTVTSMIAFDILQLDPYCFGFVGTYGSRTANFIAAKSDLIISIGSRMDIRQIGARRIEFAPKARLIRFDVDAEELKYKVRSNETQLLMSIDEAFYLLERVKLTKDYTKWMAVCHEIEHLLAGYDDQLTNYLVKKISCYLPEQAIITTDVGQNQVWIAQSLQLKKEQKVLFSGGHGAMGYSLPAAIGACYASGRAPVICFTGDGGLQMNVQELQYVSRENLPIKIIVFNNNALGMIRHFQEMYFECMYYQTTPEGGYTTPCFANIAKAYKIRGIQMKATDDLVELEELLIDKAPLLLEVLIEENTYVFPKLEFGKPNQDQEPLLEKELYERIMKMDV